MANMRPPPSGGTSGGSPSDLRVWFVLMFTFSCVFLHPVQSICFTDSCSWRLKVKSNDLNSLLSSLCHSELWSDDEPRRLKLIRLKLTLTYLFGRFKGIKMPTAPPRGRSGDVHTDVLGPQWRSFTGCKHAWKMTSVVTLARMKLIKQIIIIKWKKIPKRPFGETFSAFNLYAKSYNLKWIFYFILL